MSLDQSFCSSPWLHMRITQQGNYKYCRWTQQVVDISDSNVNLHNIRNLRPLEFFQQAMSDVRQQLLNGQSPDGCATCMVMEKHGKVSGRQKQLLKVGVRQEHFEKTLASSPFRKDFDYSLNNQGHTQRGIVDWQIDLGNFCNGACVFCHPIASSKLATEWLKLGLISQPPAPNWCDDPELMQMFIDDLVASPNLVYLHFVGGETLITPGFRQILTALVEHNLANKITLGFTTNLSSWSESMMDLLSNFDRVNLGMSVETLTKTNDYVRYPSKIDQVRETIEKWRDFGAKQDWLMQLRLTPTCLSILEIDTVYDYAWNNNIPTEACFFLDKPSYMRIGVLPQEYRQKAAARLRAWVDAHDDGQRSLSLNTRDPNQAKVQICQEARSYLHHLENTADESERLPDLMKFLKKIDAYRGVSVLDYLPQYEEIFRSAGY